MRIALLEDDPVQADTLLSILNQAGHHCLHFPSGKELVRSLAKDSYDLFILDWMVPGMTGPEVLDWIRQHRGHEVPVLFITAREDEKDIVEALQRGADDYIVKPPRAAETLARIQALMRRRGIKSDEEKLLEDGPYRFDLQLQEAHFGQEAVPLTQKQFELAIYLFRNQGRLLSRSHLLSEVWGTEAQLQTRTVDTHVSHVRNKLQLFPENGFRIVSVYGHGYRFERVEFGQEDDGPTESPAHE